MFYLSVARMHLVLLVEITLLKELHRHRHGMNHLVLKDLVKDSAHMDLNTILSLHLQVCFFLSHTRLLVLLIVFTSHLFAQVTFLRSLTNKQTFLSAFFLFLSLSRCHCVSTGSLEERTGIVFRFYSLSLSLSLYLLILHSACPLTGTLCSFIFFLFTLTPLHQYPASIFLALLLLYWVFFFCSFYHFHITTWRSHCFALFFFFLLSLVLAFFSFLWHLPLFILCLCVCFFFSLLFRSLTRLAHFSFVFSSFLFSLDSFLPVLIALMYPASITHPAWITHTLSFFLFFSLFFTPWDRQ